MGEIEGDKMRGGREREVDRAPAEREGIGVRKGDAAGDRDRVRSTGAASVQSSELLLFDGGS